MSEENNNTPAEEVNSASSLPDVKEVKQASVEEVNHRVFTERWKREEKKLLEKLQTLESKLEAFAKPQVKDEDVKDLKTKSLEAKVLELEDYKKKLESEKQEELSKRLEAEKNIKIVELLNHNSISGDHQDLAKELLSKKFKLENGELFWVDDNTATSADSGLKKFLESKVGKILTPPTNIPQKIQNKTKQLSDKSQKILEAFHGSSK